MSLTRALPVPRLRQYAAASMMGSALALSAPIVPQTTSPTSPPHRRHHALTYDPASKRVLLYGGQQVVSNTETPVLDDLWGWDGKQWTRIAASTGTGMIGHKLFADGIGSVIAVGNPRAAGGFSSPNAQPLTARWDGTEWMPLGDSTPARESAAGSFDSQRKRFVLFGGLVGNRLAGDTWEFIGERWVRVATSGPSPSLGASMAYDVKRQVTVLFGGLDSTGRKSGETWEWNGAQWTRVSTTGPAPRFGAGMAYDTRRGETILFGGVDSAYKKLNDTWRWDGEHWRKADTPVAPSPRSGELAFDDARHVIVLFGGEGVEVPPTLGDTWEWDGARWMKLR